MVYGLLQVGYMALRGGPLEAIVIDRGTVWPAAHLISALFPNDGVVAIGPRVSWPTGYLTLLNGCDGIEVAALFAAGVLVAPIGLRRGALALLAGCMGVWTLNQVRLATLYWAYRYHPGWFDSIHAVWGPAVLIAFVTALFWGWVLKRPVPGHIA